MSLTNNTFKSKRYLRTKFREGKYLLSSEASDLQLESQELIKEFIKSSYGDFALDDAFKPDQTSSTQITIKPGFAWKDGLPFILKSGSDAKVILGNVPVGVTLTEVSASVGNKGGKRLVLSGLANGSYSVVVEASEELVKPSGVGAVDTYLQGVNVGEETAVKSRLIYKLHVVLTSALTSTPTYPLASPNHYVNEIIITPTGGSNFLTSSTDITQDLNGADRKIIINNSTANIPYGSEAQEYVGGLLIDSDGNEMVITSITTTDAGATVQILLDREVDYNSSNPKAGLPIITTSVPYKLVKADYYVTTTTGEPLGKSYWKLANFVFTAGAITSLTDLRHITAVNSFEKDLNIRLTGGGNISWSTGTNNLSWSSDLRLGMPGNTIGVIPTGSVNLPTNGSVSYITLQRSNTGFISYTPAVATMDSLLNSAHIYVFAYRTDNRVYFPDNGSIGNGQTILLGGAASSIPPIGSIIPFYDFNGLVSFDTGVWAYCDGSVLVDGASPLNGQTLPDLSNRYLVGFSTPWVVETIASPGGPQGTGYTVGNVLTIATGGNNATVLVNNVNGGGGITNYSLIQGGTGYTVTGTFNLTGGTGTGAQVDIDSLTDGQSIGVAAFSATPVGAVKHEISLSHFHSLSAHTHTVAHSHSLTPGTAWAQIFTNGALWHNRVSGVTAYSHTRQSGLTSDVGSVGSTSFATGVDGNTDSGTPTTSPPSTTNTSSALTTAQNIQPRSVRVRYIIRKV